MGKDKFHTYNHIISTAKKKRFYFKLPKLLYLVMQDKIQKNHNNDQSLSGYYLDLVGFSFYCQYELYFNEVLAKQQAQEYSLYLNDLHLLSQEQRNRAEVTTFADRAINNRQCPAILIEVSEYLRVKTGSSDKQNSFFRRLTLPFAIAQLEQEIAQKKQDLAEGKAQSAPTSKQLNQLKIFNWLKK